MDHIEAFAFGLDISNQEAIYDYVAKEELRRPVDGNWDVSLFKGRGSLQQIPADDENEKMRVWLMDKSIMETSLLEKKISPESEPAQTATSGVYSSFDDSAFGFSDPEASTDYLPRRLLPIYKRGDIVKGQLLLSLNKPLDAKALKLKFVGQVKVKLRIYHQHGYHDDIQREKFMEDEKVLWEKSKSDKSNISDRFSLLAKSDTPACSPNLSAGKHTFDFEYIIPDDAPQSVPPLVISSHNEGHLQWHLKAEIEVPGTLFKHGHVCTHQGLLVKYPLDIASDPKHLEPVSLQETLDTGISILWNAGKVIVKADLKKMGHVRGNSLPVRIEVQNQTKSDIPSVTAQIRMVGKAKLGTSRLSCSNSVKCKGEKIKEGPIAAGAGCVYNMVLPWDFSNSSADGRLLPVGYLEESKLLEVKYNVEIKVKRKGLSRDINMEVPIFVGTHDSSDL